MASSSELFEKYTVDTSVWIDFFNGKDTQEVQALRFLLANKKLYTCDVIITEFLQGFREEKNFQLAKEMMDSLNYLTIHSKKMAVQSAVNFRYLRTEGITIRKTIDMLIGTWCIENNLILLHKDKDFEPMVTHLGLKVYDVYV